MRLRPTNLASLIKCEHPQAIEVGIPARCIRKTSVPGQIFPAPSFVGMAGCLLNKAWLDDVRLSRSPTSFITYGIQRIGACVPTYTSLARAHEAEACEDGWVLPDAAETQVTGTASCGAKSQRMYPWGARDFTPSKAANPGEHVGKPPPPFGKYHTTQYCGFRWSG